MGIDFCKTSPAGGQVYSICGSREDEGIAETVQLVLEEARGGLSTDWSAEVQGNLAHKKTPPPYDYHRPPAGF